MNFRKQTRTFRPALNFAMRAFWCRISLIDGNFLLLPWTWGGGGGGGGLNRKGAYSKTLLSASRQNEVLYLKFSHVGHDASLCVTLV